ncbi:c-type cytochrome, partial [Planctomycetota bacterium]
GLHTVAILVITPCLFGKDVSFSVSKYLSPLSVIAAHDGQTLYVAQGTAGAIVYVDVSSGKVTRSVPLGGELNGLALAPDGKTLYAAVGGFAGQIHIVNIASGEIESSLDVGHTPTAPAVSTDGKTLYVCQRFEDRVIAIDLTTQEIVAKVPVIREPVATAITPDGKKLFVANFLPAGRGDGDYAAATVTVIDTTEKKSCATVSLPNGSIDLRGITVSPDGQYVYVTHVLARYQMPTTHLDRGWMNTNALSILKTSDNSLLTTVLLDEVDQGAANPWGVACTADGDYLCVAHSGSHELGVIDRVALHEKIHQVSLGQKVSDASASLKDIPNDLSFVYALRRRIKLSGNGPRNLTLIGTKAYVCEYFTDSIGVVDIDPAQKPKPVSLALGPQTEMDLVRKGEMFFYDASLCFQNWQSCASCHPADGRPDALNWDLMNDGIGNPKNTKSLLLSHATPPAMASGARDSAEDAVRSGIRFIQFADRPDEDARAIDAYLKSLTPIPSPYLKKGRSSPTELSQTAKRGKQLFVRAGCASCHSGSLYTDLKSYDVGTGRDAQVGDKFDTPTLIETWRTAPYLYDGRAATMKDVVTTFNKNDRHGKTGTLTEEELDALVEYVLSL